MDGLMPKSRRKNDFCKSNRSAFGGPATPNRVIHEMIATTTSKNELGDLISPSKYYKLNMQPLVSNRQPTIEFRQHSVTQNKMKIKNWIRFCVAFVHNSARFRAPSYLSSADVDDEIFEMLFMYVVKDRFLHNFYRQRRIDVATEQSSCCDGCASDGGCAAGSRFTEAKNVA